MQVPVKHILLQQTLWLSPEKVIFWEEEKTLIVSDLHLGKTGHFRKAGIPVPQLSYQGDLHRLFQQIQYFQPVRLIITGDLFHSHANKELLLFRKWRMDFADLPMLLIKGNHDILHKDWYQESRITLLNQMSFSPFDFIHDPAEISTSGHTGNYRFSGHLHPGVTIKGLGKQSLRFPCFYFGEKTAVLPAFGKFTGISPVSPVRGDSVFAIVEKKVIRLK